MTEENKSASSSATPGENKPAPQEEDTKKESGIKNQESSEENKEETSDPGNAKVKTAEKSTEEPEESKKELKDFSYLKPGMTVKVHQKIQEAGKKKGETKERVQIFEGMIIAMRGTGISKTITVRKVSEGIGVEKIFPLHLPTIVKIEPIKQAKVRRAKLYYLRDHKKKLKEKKVKKDK